MQPVALSQTQNLPTVKGGPILACVTRTPARSHSPTIRDVASAAGVSPSTVSRVFTRPELISAATVERVASLAAEMGYSPDQTARSLSTGYKETVALLVPDIANPFFPPLIKGVERYFQRKGVSVLLAETDEEPSREAQLAQAFRGRVDGVILTSPRSDADELRKLTGRLPLVLVNRDVPGVHRVLIDTASGIRDGIAHLAELGHRSLAYIAGPDQSWSNTERRRAFDAGCAEHGLTHFVITSARPDYASGVGTAAAVLATGATGVIAFDDTLAHGLISGVTEQGYRVPEDLSVIGCDDLPTPVTIPHLTSISAPVGRAGELAARQLEALMARPDAVGAEAPILPEIVLGSLRIRNTTAPVQRYPRT